MKTKYSIIAFFLLFSIQDVFAHALWIETSAQGKQGKSQEVKVFYGEYANGLIEDFEGWYSDVEDFELWLIAPDKKAVQLKCDSVDNYFVTQFTPEQKGTYTLAISHSAKDLGGDYMYQFNTTSKVVVGSQEGFSNLAPENDIQVQLNAENSLVKKKTISGKTLVQGNIVGDIKVEIVAPNGWVKTVKSDANGEFRFEAPVSGKYLIEASFTEDVEGEHHGAKYGHIWRCATYFLEIN